MNIEAIKRFISTLATICVLFVVIMLFLMRPQEYKLHGFRWTNTIDIEQYKTVSESDWHLPPEARLRYTNREVRRYDEEIVGYDYEYDSEGNRTKVPVYEEVPVYGIKYYYDIDKWLKIDEKTSTAEDRDITDPDLGITENTANELGNKKRGKQRIKYEVLASLSDKQPKYYNISKDDFYRLEKGQSFKAANTLGTLKIIWKKYE